MLESLPVALKFNNPYLDFLKANTIAKEDWWPISGTRQCFAARSGLSNSYDRLRLAEYHQDPNDPEHIKKVKSLPIVDRRDLVLKYSWAIPDENAIAILASLSPIIEIGAGNGYWASLIAQAGAIITAYDREIRPKNELWYPIRLGGPGAAAKNKDATLFLCWPPYSTPMAFDAAKSYSGNTIVYVGESGGGCTANDDFHGYLEANFTLKFQYAIPCWEGIRDSLMVYQR